MMYEVDAHNKVVDVDTEWDVEAERAAGSEGPLRQRILGRSLESFMAGDATKMFVRAALDAARILGEARVLPYRCDVPGERRYMEMVVSPLDDGHVRVTHRLVKAEAMPPRRPWPRVRIVGGWRCSQCCRVRLSGSEEWIETEDQFDARLLSDVCPECANALFDHAK